METVLKELEDIDDILSCCVISDSEVVASTFGEKTTGDMSGLGKVLLQIGRGLDGIGHNLNEVMLEFDGGFLVAYLLAPKLFLALLVNKKANFSLVRVSVQSAGQQIVQIVEPGSSPRPKKAKPAAIAKRPAQEPSKSHVKGQVTGKAAAAAPVQAPAQLDIEPILQQIMGLLIENIGPAAKIVFNQAIKRWQASGGPKQKDLPELAEILVQDIDDDNEKEAFLSEVGQLIGNGE